MIPSLARAAMVLAVLILLPAASSTRLTSEELLAEITGHTFSGSNSGKVNFSEYHAPDGRVFGFNNDEAVDGGCWRIRDDSVCYYYPRGSITGDFCWRMSRAGTDTYRIEHTQSDAHGLVLRKTGNPEALHDHGKNWTCNALLS
jgi:hypothetical protein